MARSLASDSASAGPSRRKYLRTLPRLSAEAADTSFALACLRRSSHVLTVTASSAGGGTGSGPIRPAVGGQPAGCPTRSSDRRSHFETRSSCAASPTLRYLRLSTGSVRGAYRNRTGVNGFAGRCVATPPRRRSQKSLATGLTAARTLRSRTHGPAPWPCRRSGRGESAASGWQRRRARRRHLPTCRARPSRR